MRRAFYVREVSNSGTRSVDATPYESKERAAHVILRHLELGSIKKGWVVDKQEQIIISAEDIFDLFHSAKKPD